MSSRKVKYSRVVSVSVIVIVIVIVSVSVSVSRGRVVHAWRARRMGRRLEHDIRVRRM